MQAGGAAALCQRLAQAGPVLATAGRIGTLTPPGRVAALAVGAMCGAQILANPPLVNESDGETGGANQTPHVNSGEAQLPTDPNRLHHIFRPRPSGTLADTPANRELLTKVASDPDTHVGTDIHGNRWHYNFDRKGNQIWVTVKNGVIQNGGLNIPRSHPTTV